MPIELKKWFQVCAGIASIAATLVCWFAVREVLPSAAATAQAGLVTLVAAAVPGFYRLLLALVPPLVTRIWPSLDR